MLKRALPKSQRFHQIRITAVCRAGQGVREVGGVLDGDQSGGGEQPRLVGIEGANDDLKLRIGQQATDTEDSRSENLTGRRAEEERIDRVAARAL